MSFLSAIRKMLRPKAAGETPALLAGGTPGATALSEDLRQIIRPEAQPRWLLPSLSLITPQYLEAILRGALLGNHVFQWMLFDLMEDTWPRLVKNLNELKLAAIEQLLVHWRIAPWAVKGKAATPEAEERSDLAEEALFGMRGNPAKNERGFRDSLYDMLDAWGKGTSMLELQWEQRESGAMGTIMAPKSTYWVHPKNYAWDGEGNLGLILPQGYDGGALGERRPTGGYGGPWARTDLRMNEPGDLVPIMEDKFLVAIAQARTGHPLGGARLRTLAWWWSASNFSADWLLNFAQVFGMPIRWTTYTRGTPQATIDKICEMLAQMGSQSWGAFPEGTRIELKEAGKAGEQLPQASILDRADKQCDLLILGETLTTHVSREGGSRALGEVHERVKEEIVQAAAGFCAEVLNTQAIPAIMRLNYGDDTMLPSFVPNEEAPEAAKANAEVIQIAVETGIPVPVEFALEKLNIPKAAKGEEIVKMPTAQGPNSLRKANGENGDKPTNGEDAMQAMSRYQNSLCHSRFTPSLPLRSESHAKATDKLVENVLEELTGVEARWLGGVKPWFAALVTKAQSEHVTDADFVKALHRASRELPELFHKLDAQAVADALEKAMGAAVVNGAAKAAMERKT